MIGELARLNSGGGAGCDGRKELKCMCVLILERRLLLLSLSARAALGLGSEADLVSDLEQSGHVLGNGAVLLDVSG